MAQYICPSCGQRFNGKKCRSCYYETYDDEISRNLHTHQEVNVPDMQPARPAQVQREWEQQKRAFRRNQEKRRNQKSRKAPKGIVWLLVILLLNPILTIAVEIIDSIYDGISTSFVTTRAPEPDAALPENAQVLFSGEGFTLYFAASEDPLRYPLFLENTTSQDVRLSARYVVVDGFLSEMSTSWCDAPEGTIRSGELLLDPEDMGWAIMDVPHRVEVTFVIYETEDYEELLEATVTILDGQSPEMPAPAGEVLVDREDLLISCLGYVPNEYDPEAFHQGTMLYYIENKTDHNLSVYGEEARINQEDATLSLWSELPGGTRTVTRMWLYTLEELDIAGKDQAGALELHLMAYDGTKSPGTQDLGWVKVKP